MAGFSVYKTSKTIRNHQFLFNHHRRSVFSIEDQIMVYKIFFIFVLFSVNLKQSTSEVLQDYHEIKKRIIPIVKYNFDQNQNSYQYSYETGNGIHVEEYGYFKHKQTDDGSVDKEHPILVQQGSVTYHDEHGHPIVLKYIADEHGFQPEGDHLPTPPPVPHEIQKNLAPEEHQLPQQHHQEQEIYQEYEEQNEHLEQ